MRPLAESAGKAARRADVRDDAAPKKVECALWCGRRMVGNQRSRAAACSVFTTQARAQREDSLTPAASFRTDSRDSSTPMATLVTRPMARGKATYVAFQTPPLCSMEDLHNGVEIRYFSCASKYRHRVENAASMLPISAFSPIRLLLELVPNSTHRAKR